jgi:hypothetical protein
MLTGTLGSMDEFNVINPANSNPATDPTTVECESGYTKPT